MTTIYLDQEDLNVHDLFATQPHLQQKVQLGFESLFMLYHGISTTPKRHYKNENIQRSVTTLMRNVAEVAEVSLEGIDIDFTNVNSISNENAFTDAIHNVIDQILAWLSKAKEWFVKLFGMMFNVRKQEASRNTKTKEDFKQASKKATAERPLPKTIECKLPGTCLLIFHWRKFDPTSKYDYTDKAIAVSIERIGKEFSTFLTRYHGTLNKLLKGVDDLIQEINQDIPTINSNTVNNITRNGVLEDYYRNGFECMGFGIIEKPIRNQTNRFKYQLTNVVSKYGWDQVESVTLRIDTENFETLNALVGKTTNDNLTAIAMATEQLSKSKSLERLADLKQVVNNKLKDLNKQGVDSSHSDYVLTESLVRRIDIVYEVVDQMVDTSQLIGMFYARYASTLNGILSGVATRLNTDQNT